MGTIQIPEKYPPACLPKANAPNSSNFCFPSYPHPICLFFLCKNPPKSSPFSPLIPVLHILSLGITHYLLPLNYDVGLKANCIVPLLTHGLLTQKQSLIASGCVLLLENWKQVKYEINMGSLGNLQRY